jgi:hypothetical protein
MGGSIAALLRLFVGRVPDPGSHARALESRAPARRGGRPVMPLSMRYGVGCSPP